MEWLITAIVAIIGCVLSVLTYFAGSKKTSNADVEKRAHFEGKIEAKLDHLIKEVEKLDITITRNTEDLHSEIDKRILEHERRYHPDAK